MEKFIAISNAIALGLVLFLSLPPAAHAASFNCNSKRLKPDERTICADRTLNDLDVKMVTEFNWLAGMFAMGMRGELRDEQSAWLKSRQACGTDRACIRKAYKTRLKKFDDLYNHFERPAPMSDN